MHPTRWAVFESIKKRELATINEIAHDVSISPITIRHHMYGLLADNLVQKTVLRGGVGRPQHRYSITEVGLRHFPSRYHTLTTHLLSALKNIKSEEAIQQVLDGIVQNLLESRPVTNGRPPKARLADLQAHFQSQGIAIDLRETPEGNVQATLRCPYYHISQHHPEICQIDTSLMVTILQMPVERESCLLEGDESCTFSIQLMDTISTN